MNHKREIVKTNITTKFLTMLIVSVFSVGFMIVMIAFSNFKTYASNLAIQNFSSMQDRLSQTRKYIKIF